MIDEWYDCAYLECRAELNAATARLFARILRKFRLTRAGENIVRAPSYAFLSALALPLMAAGPPSPKPLSLPGTWVMQQAYEIRADGTRATNYGEHPSGLMMVDRAGRYSIQIFRPRRPNFTSGVKAEGKPEEYREAVLGSSTHFGHVRVDPAAHQLLFDVESASFPNWEGKRQVRDYTYADGVLTYSVPASASGNGTIAYSVWSKVP